MKVFTLNRFCWFKDCGLNKNATADSWFSLTATSARWLCSRVGLRPKWQLWSRRTITMFPQCSANDRRLTPQPHVNSGVQMKRESGQGTPTAARKAAGKTTVDTEHTHSSFYQKQRRTCWLETNTSKFDGHFFYVYTTALPPLPRFQNLMKVVIMNLVTLTNREQESCVKETLFGLHVIVCSCKKGK